MKTTFHILTAVVIVSHLFICVYYIKCYAVQYNILSLLSSKAPLRLVSIQSIITVTLYLGQSEDTSGNYNSKHS